MVLTLNQHILEFFMWLAIYEHIKPSSYEQDDDIKCPGPRRCMVFRWELASGHSYYTI